MCVLLLRFTCTHVTRSMSMPSANKECIATKEQREKRKAKRTMA
jgi:hypothetical protein